MKLTKTLLTTTLFGASVFSFQSTAWADTPEQQFQQGLTAYKQSDYQTAFKLWLPLAEQGDVQAQLKLGSMYELGLGVKQDDVEAVKWYRQAAEQGHEGAQFNLGLMYETGRGVKQDDFEAVKWYRKAAENGEKRAQFNLGVRYFNGDGVRQDDEQAKEWFGKACDNGYQKGCQLYSKLNRGKR